MQRVGVRMLRGMESLDSSRAGVRYHRFRMIPSEEQRHIRDAARAFAQKEIVPHAAQWDRDCMVPVGVLRAMGPLGLMGMCVAPEWGGAGADFVSYALATEEIAAGDCGLCNMMC